MDFTGNQTVQGPKDSFNANCSKGFKRFRWCKCFFLIISLLQNINICWNLSSGLF